MKSFHPFRLDETNQCLWRGDSRVTLTPKPFAVLQYLVNHPGRLITHDELLSAVWPDTYVQPEVLRRYILEIRRVLGDQAEKPFFVETLPKRGYQFIAPVTDSIQAPANGLQSSAARLVGRESALKNLESYLTKALNGQRQLVFVSGEAGVGKTSLVDAFQRGAENLPDVRVARGQAVEGFGGKEAYYPVLEALGQLSRGPGSELIIGTLTKYAPTWTVQFASLVEPEQHERLQREVLGATRERMVRELCEALETISTTTPLVFIFEDLHWVDPSTVDLFSAIARRREPARLLLVSTFRPADLILSESPFKTLKQDLTLHHLGSEVLLERLDESAVAEYVAAEFGEAELPRGFSTIIYRHSDGNPLFMTAMLDHLIQRGILSQADGPWRITVPLEQIDPGVPETLRQMLEVQLEHSSDAEQQLLKCASVAGKQFTAWAVATMMRSDLWDVEEACAASSERLQFLKTSGLRELPDGTLTLEYEFRHALYREVLYRRLGPAQRVKYHRLLAEGLESLRSQESASEIALHFEEGREYEKAIQYLIAAAGCATRRYAHRESVETLEHALQLLPKLTPERAQELDVQILEKIGDSQYAFGDIQKSAATYHMMATHAAEAGLLTAQANALMRLAHSAEAIPFFTRAIELDPNFASAYVSLSRIYSNLGEVDRAVEYAKLAYEHRDHVSERERLSIDYQYYYEETGDQTRAIQTLEIWKRTFPKEFQPPNSLAFTYNLLGQFDRAIDEAREAVRRNPNHGFPYSNLANAYRGAGRFDDALQTAERAVALNIETLPTRRLLYQLAILAGDEERAQRHLEWSRDRPREFEIVGCRAQIAGCSGRLNEARELYEETVRMAEFRNLGAVGTNHLAWASWMELVYGNYDRAVQLARRVLSRNPSYDARLRVALPLAMCGFIAEAEAIVNKLVNDNPDHTCINSIMAPIVNAGIAIARREPQQAIELLQVAAPYERGFIAALAPIYLRAQAFLLLGASCQAAGEFRRVSEHRGSDPFSALCSAASVGEARAHALWGDVKTSAEAYSRFLNAWKTADPDVPLLLEAQAEYENLTLT